MSTKRVIEVRCRLPKRTVLSMAVLIVGSANKALMPVFVAARVGIWFETANRTEVKFKVMLNLGLIHRV